MSNRKNSATNLRKREQRTDIEVRITSPQGGDNVTSPITATGTVSVGVASLAFSLVNLQNGTSLRTGISLGKETPKDKQLDTWTHTFGAVEVGFYALTVTATKDTTQVLRFDIDRR